MYIFIVMMPWEQLLINAARLDIGAIGLILNIIWEDGLPGALQKPNATID